MPLCIYVCLWIPQKRLESYIEFLQIRLVKENKFFIFVEHKCLYSASTKSMLKFPREIVMIIKIMIEFGA
jgi:hypothetical protein